MKKVMLSVAPVSAADTYIDPDRIARDVIECYKNGASMVHLHVRDRSGKLTPELSLLTETVEKIRAACDIVVEISTGGVSDLTIDERIRPLYADYTEAASLNVGSVNLGEAVYQNPIRDVRLCVREIIAQKKIPEIEVFELGMIHTVKELDDSFHFVKPILFALVFGFPCECANFWNLFYRSSLWMSLIPFPYRRRVPLISRDPEQDLNDFDEFLLVHFLPLQKCVRPSFLAQLYCHARFERAI